MNLCVIALESRAWALVGRPRVLVLTADPVLERSLEVALAPWKLEIVTIDGETLGDAVAAASDRATELARRYRATVVMWIGSNQTGRSVWIFDASARTLMHRQEPDRGDSAAAAASVALSVKTLLRASTIVPLEERAEATERAPARETAAPVWLRVEAQAGVRWFDLDDGTFDTRVGGLVSFWPRRWGGRVGAALGVSLGSGIEIEPLTGGRFGDTSIELLLARRFSLPHRLVLEPAIGASLHITDLAGAVGSPAIRVHDRRANPSLDAALVWGASPLPHLQIGLHAGLSWLLQAQRYLAAGALVFEPAAWELDLGVQLALGVSR
jgi:hypothetical protein